jgi:pheromone shutdown protein TraB
MKFWIGIRGAKYVIACALANIHIICYVFAFSFSWFDIRVPRCAAGEFKLFKHKKNT